MEPRGSERAVLSAVWGNPRGISTHETAILCPHEGTGAQAQGRLTAEPGAAALREHQVGALAAGVCGRWRGPGPPRDWPEKTHPSARPR